ncbi:unnamed protein product [Prunus brigantina]
MKFSHMWRKIHGEFYERLGSLRKEMALASRWKILNKEDVLAKARDNVRSSENRGNKIIQAQM